jgi:hypothetical protein
LETQILLLTLELVNEHDRAINIMKKIFGTFFVLGMISTQGFSQKTCTSNPTTINSNINFGAITWTASGGATVTECNNMADGLITFNGNVIVDLANNRTITITNDVNINGNFPISGGPGAALSVNGGFTLHVTGDLGDADNNGVQYEVVTAADRIIVDGTLYGKNNNAFTGNGSISGGTLDVKNGSTCGSPCPVSGGFSNCTSGDPFCATYGVLPVILTDFRAERGGDVVRLHWTTSTEINFEKFVIQRSQQGIDFEDIGEVFGAGRNIDNLETHYTFEDQFPLLGTNYYRLKAVDFDRHYEYSDIVGLALTGAKSMDVFPNPSTGAAIEVSLNFNPSENGQLVILDNIGTEILRSTVSGTKTQLIFPAKLGNGVYIVKYSTSSFEGSSRFLVRQ